MNLKKLALISLGLLGPVVLAIAPAFADNATSDEAATALTQMSTDMGTVSTLVGNIVPVAVGSTAFSAGMVIIKRVVFS
jgi:hypothetical protein